MKYYPGIVQIAALLIAVMSCSSDVGDTQTALLSGKIQNPKAEYVILFHGEKKDTIPMDTGGYFQYEFIIPQATYYGFKHGHEYTELFLAPGDSLYLELDPEFFDESLKYRGRGAAANSYLAAKYLLKEKLLPPHKELYTLDRGVFEVKMDSLKSAMENLFRERTKDGAEYSKEFLRQEPTSALYQWAKTRLRYPDYYRHYAKKTLEDTAGYFAFLNNLDFNKADLLSIKNYRNFLEAVIDTEFSAVRARDSTLESDGLRRMGALFDVIESRIKNQTIIDFLLVKKMALHIEYYGVKDYTEELVQIFETKCTDVKEVARVKKLFQKKLVMTPGKPAPAFDCFDMDSNSVTLASLKSKYVYVDFWATWCQPCLAEIPAYKTLQSDYQAKNIAFVSASVDEDHGAWQKMVREKELSGVQIYCGGKLKDKTYSDYQIKGIPTFVLIDPEGNLIEYQAPRPSSPDIRKRLDKLLG